MFINDAICGYDEVHINAINAAYIGEGIDIDELEQEIYAFAEATMMEMMGEFNVIMEEFEYVMYTFEIVMAGDAESGAFIQECSL